VLYHGILAPNAKWRRQVVTYERGPTEELHQRSDTLDTPVPEPVTPAPAPGRPRYWVWAALMRRAFEIDVLACSRCGGRMHLIATVEDPAIIRRILAHLGLWPASEPRSAPRPVHQRFRVPAHRHVLTHRCRPNDGSSRSWHHRRPFGDPSFGNRCYDPMRPLDYPPALAHDPGRPALIPAPFDGGAQRWLERLRGQ
jgi:hypothetical protein